MSERNHALTLGTLLFGIILFVAIGSRASNLSEAPLSDVEATHALAAFEALYPDDSESFGTRQRATNAAYHVGTIGLFSLLPITNAIRRWNVSDMRMKSPFCL